MTKTAEELAIDAAEIEQHIRDWIGEDRYGPAAFIRKEHYKAFAERLAREGKVSEEAVKAEIRTAVKQFPGLVYPNLAEVQSAHAPKGEPLPKSLKEKMSPQERMLYADTGIRPVAQSKTPYGDALSKLSPKLRMEYSDLLKSGSPIPEYFRQVHALNPNKR